MANIQPTTANPGQNVLVYKQWRLVTWAAILNGDTGLPVELPDFADRSFQLAGTFGTGGSVTLEGSNDGTNYIALTDPQGNAITKTAAAIEQVEECTRYVRPRCTAGDGTTSLTVTMLFKE